MSKDPYFKTKSQQNLSQQPLSTISSKPAYVESQEPLLSVNPNAWTPDSSQIEEEEDNSLRFVDKTVQKDITKTGGGADTLTQDPNYVEPPSHGIPGKRCADGLSSSSHSQSNELGIENKRTQKKERVEPYTSHKRNSSQGHVDSRLVVYRNNQGKTPKSQTHKDTISAFNVSSKSTEKLPAATDSLSINRTIKTKTEYTVSENKEGDTEAFPFQTIDPPKLFDTRKDHDNSNSESKDNILVTAKAAPNKTMKSHPEASYHNYQRTLPSSTPNVTGKANIHSSSSLSKKQMMR
jgi:hypothetical protein